MDTLSAFARGQANQGKESMVFDWFRAVELINQYQPKLAEAGLKDDFEYTGGDIFTNGEIVDQDDTYTYLASTWATPQLVLDGEVFDCYKMQSEVPDWGSDTYWPEEAKTLLKVTISNGVS